MKGRILCIVIVSLMASAWAADPETEVAEEPEVFVVEEIIAKVNGQIVPLQYELKTGDTVEIITSKNHHPSKDWLNFVKTVKARSKIRQWIKIQEKDRSLSLGREMCEKVYMAPFEAKWKIFIIEDAERMLPTSANALLKTFEEPAPNSVIILISDHPERLLPTVLSRCRKVHFQGETPLNKGEIDEKILNLLPIQVAKGFPLFKR